MDAEGGTVEKRDLVMYMDVLGHDILNNNQAVMGYLDLIQASVDSPRKVREYSLRAASHVMSATLLMDNIKKLVEARRRTGPLSPSAVDLQSVLERACEELLRLFPERNIDVAVDVAGLRPVTSEGLVHNLALSLSADLIRLDDKKDVTLEVSATRLDGEAGRAWTLRLHRRDAVTPSYLREGFSRSFSGLDVSKMVKMTGAIFATLLVRQIRGKVGLEEGSGDSGGVTFAVTLIEEDGT